MYPSRWRPTPAARPVCPRRSAASPDSGRAPGAGRATDLYTESLAPEVRAGFESTCALLRQEGAILVEVRIDRLTELDEAIGVPVAVHEASIALPAFCASIGLPFERLAAAWARSAADVLVAPACPVVVPCRGAGSTVRLGGADRPQFPAVSRNTGPAGLLGMPSVSLPLPRSDGGPSSGLLVEARPGDDRRLLSIAAVVAGVLGQR